MHVTVNMDGLTVTYCSLSIVTSNNNTCFINSYGLCRSGFWEVHGWGLLTWVISGGCPQAGMELDKHELTISGGWPDISLSSCGLSAWASWVSSQHGSLRVVVLPYMVAQNSNVVPANEVEVASSFVT